MTNRKKEKQTKKTTKENLNTEQKPLSLEKKINIHRQTYRQNHFKNPVYIYLYIYLYILYISIQLFSSPLYGILYIHTIGIS